MWGCLLTNRYIYTLFFPITCNSLRDTGLYYTNRHLYCYWVMDSDGMYHGDI